MQTEGKTQNVKRGNKKQKQHPGPGQKEAEREAIESLAQPTTWLAARSGRRLGCQDAARGWALPQLYKGAGHSGQRWCVAAERLDGRLMIVPGCLRNSGFPELFEGSGVTHSVPSTAVNRMLGTPVNACSHMSRVFGFGF